jgi:hypothetical protein
VCGLQTASGHPTILQTPQIPSANGRVHPSEAPLNFPTKAAKSGSERPLKHNDSIRSQDDDPEMATPLNLGSVCNTVVAQYEFKSLEFARPTRMVRSPSPRWQLSATGSPNTRLRHCGAPPQTVQRPQQLGVSVVPKYYANDVSDT